jgi:uncharacterized protein (TIGR02145 family)
MTCNTLNKSFLQLLAFFGILLLSNCDSSTEPKDCAGVSGGGAFIDDCGICISEESGLIENYLMDCAGVCGGSAFINECDYCVGGETGLPVGKCDPITDIDGNIYDTIYLGNQLWMAENLKVTHYRDSTEIPNITNYSEWSSLSSGAYGNLYNDSGIADTYGRLYNWHAVDDNRDICPDGWHVPMDEEWMELEMYLGMSQSEAESIGYRGNDEGSQLAGNADLWFGNGNLEIDPAFGSSGFDALPGGYRTYDTGNYFYMGLHGDFWSSTVYTNSHAWFRTLDNYSLKVYRYRNDKRNGFSIRCVKD